MLERFFRSSQPANLEARVFRRSQAKMQTQIILRAETSAATHLLHLPAIARVHDYTRTDRRAVRPGSDQLHQQPEVGGWRLVAK